MEENVCRHHQGTKIVGIVVLGIVLVVALLQQTIIPSTDSVTVVGQGRVQVKPDVAVVDLGIMTLKAADTKSALEQTTQKVGKVEAVLDQFGVSKDDWQITGYAYNPVYDDGSSSCSGDNCPSDSSKANPNAVSGYNGFQQITVRIHGVDQDKQKIDSFIEAAIAAGANQVGTVHFVYSDIEKAKQDARLKAIADAKGKVDTMVKTAGIKVKGVSGWSENVVSAPGQTYNEGTASSGYSDLSFNNENNPVSNSLGNQTEVIIDVTMNYKIK